MSNIQKELKASKKAELSSIEKSDVVKEVKLLMDSDAQEDLRILNALGRNNSIGYVTEQLGKKLELEKMDEKYKGEVYTVKQLQKLAIKYNLRLLPATKFTGKLDVQVAPKLRRFAQETNTEITTGSLEYNFFIMAPEKSFELREERAERWFDNRDPAIFYKINETHFRLVHKWGSDFTLSNRIQGLLNESPQMAMLVNLFRIGLPVFLITFLWIGMAWYWAGLISVFLTSMGQAGRMHEGPYNFRSKMYSKGKWRSDVKTV